ncbi:MAG: putative metal-binding motif-containing protein, partial [Myxococcota bacterium]|nr:putative metal-binding motif-containing protein [Myxococcota bacterium]
MTVSRIAVGACLAVAFGCAEPEDAVPVGDGDDGGDAADDGRPDRSDADDGGDTADDAEEAPEAADGDAENGDDGDASPGILGDPCVRHADCLVGYCVESPEGDRVCSGTCAGSCPAPYEHWECRAMRTGGASIVMLCLPPNDLLCAACFRDDQCGSVRALCLDYPIGRFCGRDCAAEECPFGFDCLDVVVRGEVHRQCRPWGGNCADCVDRDGDLRGAGVDCLGPDCDDADPLRHDGAVELVDSIDNDCDGLTDEGTPVYDDDDDGFCEVGPCVHGALGDGDCDDGDASINPGTPELRNGVDDDCDGAVDDGTTAYDDDGDGYCEVGPCVRGTMGEGDCDDSNSRIHPGAPEDGGTGTGAPDGRDNDCDGTTDEGTTAYDDDGDGFCEVAPCVNAPAGGDCDDANPLRSPGRAEVVDGLDNDCDGLVDEGTPVYDDDGDGFCEIAPCVNAPAGGDCDDADRRVHPGAPEDGGTGTGAPDGRDNDCDGATDEGTTAYDDDGDGFCEVGPCLGAGILPGDCADDNPARNPGRLEVCGNGVDDDCDGTTDQVDNDGDGAQDLACGGNDCDDTDPSVRPGRPEIRDAKDNNCDGRYDEGLVQAGDVVVTEIMHNPA